MLSAEDEAVVVAFRRHTRLPLDDGLYALQATVPHLTRPSLHCCHRCTAACNVTKLACVERHENATRRVAGDVLRALVKAMPYTIHTVLTDHDTHVTSPGTTGLAAAGTRRAMEDGEPFLAHAFEYACELRPTIEDPQGLTP